jgi:hypothetical protein
MCEKKIWLHYKRCRLLDYDAITYVSEDPANYIFNTEYYSSTRSVMIYQSARCRNQMIIITAVRISSIKVGALPNGTVEVELHHLWMVSFTRRPLYPQGKSSRYPLDRMFGGSQSQPGRCGAWKNLLPLQGIESQSSSPSPCWLSYPSSWVSSVVAQ